LVISYPFQVFRESFAVLIRLSSDSAGGDEMNLGQSDLITNIGELISNNMAQLPQLLLNNPAKLPMVST